MTRRKIHSLWLVLAASLWMTLAGNSALWQRLAALGLMKSLSGLGFVLALGGLLLASLAGILALFAWKRSLKPVLTVLLLVTAFASHFMNSFGIVIDPSMVTNAVQTDVRETSALLNLGLAANVLCLALIPIWLIWRQPVAYGTLGRQLWKNFAAVALSLVAIMALLALSYQSMASTMRNHKDLRYLLNPLAGVYSAARVALKPWELDPSVLHPIGEDARARASAKPLTLLLVVGETARSDHFSLNGYERETNAELQQRGVISQQSAWSCGTSTAESLPCMFAHLGREDFNSRKMNYENLLDLLQKAGLNVLWAENQSGCKEVCNRVPVVKVTDTCGNAECFDEAMLDAVQKRLQAMDERQRSKGTVIVLHQMGSHGPAYYKRSPQDFKAFLPECTTNALKDCSQESVRNAYDNSIRYTDHFLAKSIDWLKARGGNSAMMYVSDHGESLGESNVYLHGLPYAFAPATQRKVPWITWLSPEFERESRLSSECLRRKAGEQVTHDSYFHAVLGLAGVTAREYQPALDFYQPCRG
ncbi:phosphoethanolamine transferase [Comamonas endophytica]|uniref:Phosphoethanolamine--lipid A transferase n=1 Tax=Comamonas endophytica TaxID=2949090 RepID=A0ABY6GFH8_9BURK|nr:MULTISPECIES: phosphoethanolamine--lipid A transferase [unclassified Acidovorax]MCD2513370.1 phosphoethanolamine--lipid A transferase [Acidovorax sp. D4N7]UYG53847.1 phosphoethanolamine--lipid A transferase [Acidovorax sp. 5MLIR]